MTRSTTGANVTVIRVHQVTLQFRGPTGLRDRPSPQFPRYIDLGWFLLFDLGVWEEDCTDTRRHSRGEENEMLEVQASSSDRREPAVRHVLAGAEVEVLEVGASSSDRLDPAVRHVLAPAEVEVLEVGASSSDRLDPAVRHGVAIADVEVLEVGASSSDRREPAVRHVLAIAEV